MKEGSGQILHSFVIPAYKDSEHLEGCINSLINQTTSSNVIITTSTPSQKTESLAAQYGLDYHVNEGNQKGIANDWNFALSKVKTPLATIAHQDDIYDSTYVEEILKASSKDSLILFTDYHDLIGQKSKEFSLNSLVKKTLLMPFLIKSTHKTKLIKKSILVFGDSICCPTVTFNLEALNDFAFSIEYQCALDWVAWLEIAERKGNFTYINKKLVKHRIHADSETTNALSSGIRQMEEEKIFKQTFGKTLGGFISRLYAVGHKGNTV